MGILYLVATPIGNLEDITARALRILREARLIAAEDTRRTQQLLNYFGIHTPLLSYHQHNERARLQAVLSALAEGDVALVSDAGTPALNDPGQLLVRAAIDAGFTVCPIPGASAPITALIASGLPTDAFLYLGYLPRKSKDRRALLQSVANLPYTLIFLETPHRLVDALADLEAILGNREGAVARELTKRHEEIARGLVGILRTQFESAPPKGEITLVIAGAPEAAPIQWEQARLQTEIQTALGRGESPSRLATRLAAQSGWARRQIYQMVLEENNV
ncbi:MAG: 16S rRNA (cytidine(1402)-2'-O)-methyltransferase [Anaerolineales bacterium]